MRHCFTECTTKLMCSIRDTRPLGKLAVLCSFRRVPGRVHKNHIPDISNMVYKRLVCRIVGNNIKSIMQEEKATEVNPFGYFKPAEEMLPLIQIVRDAYHGLHGVLLSLPASRQRAVAITELETSAMWAIKGLVLNDAGSTQPEESGVTGD